MGSAAYFFENKLITSLTAVDIVNEDSDYPAENYANAQAAIRCFTTNKTAIKIRVTLNASYPLQVFSIINHNLNGGTIDINSYTAGDWSTGKTVEATGLSVRALDWFYKHSSSMVGRAYWELDLTSATSADSVFKIGYVMMNSIGGLVSLTDLEDWEQPRSYGFQNVINETDYGVRWAHKLSERREGFTLGWKARTASSLPDELRTLFETINGMAEPFFFIPDLDLTDCYYVYSQDDILTWTQLTGGSGPEYVQGFRLNLIEAVRGKV